MSFKLFAQDGSPEYLPVRDLLGELFTGLGTTAMIAIGIFWIIVLIMCCYRAVKQGSPGRIPILLLVFILPMIFAYVLGLLFAALGIPAWFMQQVQDPPTSATLVLWWFVLLVIVLVVCLFARAWKVVVALIVLIIVLLLLALFLPGVLLWIWHWFLILLIAVAVMTVFFSVFPWLIINAFMAWHVAESGSKATGGVIAMLIWTLIANLVTGGIIGSAAIMETFFASF
ncbi:MAG TPA: hypothetical protein VD735_00580 [Candidatus Saccharimonadales bacterium]|nr:hypothetical protein [Candidatus Saccharimonadales bacterium]